MPNERYVTLEALLPADPEDGQVFEMPAGQVGGASTMTFLYAGGKCIGYASQYARVANVSHYAYLSRAITTTPLAEGTQLRILGEQFTFKSLEFTNFFGWGVKEYHPSPEVLLDGAYVVVHAVPLRKQGSDFYVFDQVCLRKTEKE